MVFLLCMHFTCILHVQVTCTHACQLHVFCMHVTCMYMLCNMYVTCSTFQVGQLVIQCIYQITSSVYSTCSIIHQFLPLFFLLTVYCYGTPALFLIPSLRSNSLAHSTSSFVVFVIFCCNKMLCAHVASMCLYAQFVL